MYMTLYNILIIFFDQQLGSSQGEPVPTLSDWELCCSWYSEALSNTWQ